MVVTNEAPDPKPDLFRFIIKSLHLLVAELRCLAKLGVAPPHEVVAAMGRIPAGGIEGQRSYQWGLASEPGHNYQLVFGPPP